MARPLHEIAREALDDPTLKASARVYASPYLEALLSCTSITDRYYADDARTCVLYALSNLQSWRGESARRIKAELKAALQ